MHHGNYAEGQQLIDITRDLLDTELTAMAGESYQRAYGAMVCVQMLAELEEVCNIFTFIVNKFETPNQCKNIYLICLKTGIIYHAFFI